MNDGNDDTRDAHGPQPVIADMPVMKPRGGMRGGRGRSTLDDHGGAPVTAPRLAISAARTTHRDLRPI